MGFYDAITAPRRAQLNTWARTLAKGYNAFAKEENKVPLDKVSEMLGVQKSKVLQDPTISPEGHTNFSGGLSNLITGNVDFQRQYLLNQYQNSFNAEQAQLTRDFNATESQKQRDWYKYMSDTSYTRAVDDMRNAGLNPYVAYTSGGSATAYGSSASVISPTATSSPSPQSSSSTASFVNSIGNLVSTGIKVMASNSSSKSSSQSSSHNDSFSNSMSSIISSAIKVLSKK